MFGHRCLTTENLWYTLNTKTYTYVQTNCTNVSYMCIYMCEYVYKYMHINSNNLANRQSTLVHYIHMYKCIYFCMYDSPSIWNIIFVHEILVLKFICMFRTNDGGKLLNNKLKLMLVAVTVKQKQKKNNWLNARKEMHFLFVQLFAYFIVFRLSNICIKNRQ